MIALIHFVLAILASLLMSKSRLEAEKAALRQQLIVLGRKARRRARLQMATVGSLCSCMDTRCPRDYSAGWTAWVTGFQ